MEDTGVSSHRCLIGLSQAEERAKGQRQHLKWQWQKYFWKWWKITINVSKNPMYQHLPLYSYSKNKDFRTFTFIHFLAHMLLLLGILSSLLFKSSTSLLVCRYVNLPEYLPIHLFSILSCIMSQAFYTSFFLPQRHP